MKAAIIGATGLLAVAGAAGVGAAVDTTGSGSGTTPLVLAGSDTLKFVVLQILANTPAAHPTSDPSTGNGVTETGSFKDGITFTGGGQSVSDAAIDTNAYQISVGTASIKSSIYLPATATTVGAPGAANGGVGQLGIDITGAGTKNFPISHTTEALLLGLDGLSILANNGAVGTVNGSGVLGAPYTYSAGTGAPLGPGQTDPTQSLPAGAFGQGLAVAGKSFVVHDHSGGHANDELGPIAANLYTTATGNTLTNSANTDGTLGGFIGTAAEEGAGTSVYHVNDSLDVIRLIFGGLHHDVQRNAVAGNFPAGGTFDAASDVRRSLVNQWEALFNTAQANGTSGRPLNHVYRRSDLAGTTNAFVALVGFGSRKIGQLTGNGNKTTSPFVNDASGAGQTVGNPTGVITLTGTRNYLSGQIATATPSTTAVTNNAGSGDSLDLDPIRRPAAFVTTGALSVDQVAEPSQTAGSSLGTLGLVLPIFYPDPPQYAAGDNSTALSPTYPLTLCDAGAFTLLQTGPGFDPAPQGPTFLNDSFQPFYVGSATKLPNDGNKHYNCLSKQSSQAFGAFATDDGRQFNLPVRKDADGTYLTDLNNRELSAAFFRIRSTGLLPFNASVYPGGIREVTSDFVSGHLVANNANTGTTITGARNATTNNSVLNDDHSIAFTGRGVDLSPGFGPSIAGLWLSGEGTGFDSTLSTPPVAQNIVNLIINPSGAPYTPVGGSTALTAAQAAVYPLARRVYLATLVGFTENPLWSDAARARAGLASSGNTFDPTAHAFINGVDQGANTAVRGLQGQEYALAKAFGDSDHLGAALLTNGFIPLPTASQYNNPAVPGPRANVITDDTALATPGQPYLAATAASFSGPLGSGGQPNWSGTYALDYPEFNTGNPTTGQGANKFLANGGSTASSTGSDQDATALSPPVLKPYGTSTAAAGFAAGPVVDPLTGAAYTFHTTWPDTNGTTETEGPFSDGNGGTVTFTNGLYF